MAIGLYKGFSSHEYQNSKTFGIKDIELVKLDLLNHIYTRKGERVMMPTFGTRIPDMPFEPLDEMSLMVIEEDLLEVVRFDPRVELMQMNVVPDYDNNMIVASLRLFYKELNMTDDLTLNIVFEEV